MTQLEFDQQANRLTAEWPRNFGEEKLLVLWTKVKRIEVRYIRDAIDEILSDFKHAPSISEISSVVFRGYSRKPHNAKGCVKCSDSGWELRDVPGNGIGYAHPCPACRA